MLFGVCIRAFQIILKVLNKGNDAIYAEKVMWMGLKLNFSYI